MLHGRYRGIFLIEDFIVRWISEERATGKTPEFRNWAWKTSYVMGMLTVELVMGGMSQVDPLTDEIIDKIAAGAKYNFTTPSGIDPWDAEGFKAGVKDMLVGKVTADSIKEFVPSVISRSSTRSLAEIPQQVQLVDQLYFRHKISHGYKK